jgi:hypothetical protein
VLAIAAGVTKDEKKGAVGFVGVGKIQNWKGLSHLPRQRGGESFHGLTFVPVLTEMR